MKWARILITSWVVVSCCGQEEQDKEKHEKKKRISAIEFVRSANRLCLKHSSVAESKLSDRAAGQSLSGTYRDSLNRNVEVNVNDNNAAIEVARRDIFAEAEKLIEDDYELEFKPLTVSDAAENGMLTITGEWRAIRRPWQEYLTPQDKLRMSRDSSLAKGFRKEAESQAQRIETINILCTIPSTVLDKEQARTAKTLTVIGSIADFYIAGTLQDPNKLENNIDAIRPAVRSITLEATELGKKPKK